MPRQHDIFASDVVDRIRSARNVWTLPAGQLLLPRVFGFCRGVNRALSMLEAACRTRGEQGRQLFLLGQIIHNPWVNEHFRRLGVRLLSSGEMARLEEIVRPEHGAVIPAFGVPLGVERRLREIGCGVVDTSCGDVRRLWVWAERAVARGFGVFIFGRSRHDETVVTKSRLADAGGHYVVAGDLEQTQTFCDMISGRRDASDFARVFDAQATNADSLAPFEHLAQVSQTTMLYDETMQVRDRLGQAFALRFSPEQADQRLLFEPTVCRATQDRQAAAVELCRDRLDLVVVVGGFGSSNTRHLYELARSYAPAVFIEDAGAILSADELRTMDLETDSPLVLRDWLPRRRPLRIGVLAGASSPEVVIGEVLERLAEFLR